MRAFIGLLILLSCFTSSAARADDASTGTADLYPRLIAARAMGTMMPPANTTVGLPPGAAEWGRFRNYLAVRQRADYVRGLSYIVSGSLAIVGGQFGEGYAADPIEKGVYTLFQTIGIASVGYGAYVWKVGSEERIFYESLASARGVDDAARWSILKEYRLQLRDREKKERIIKAITHGMIAAFNFYTASQQSSDPVKNSLFFIGGVNLLATVSYSF